MHFLKGKKILITGAAGLVGTNTLIRLKNDPDIFVKAADCKKEPNVLSDNISYVQADLTNYDNCKEIVENIDYLMMFAAKIVRRSADLRHLLPNLSINLNMLEAAYHAGVKKVVWLSSATAYPPFDSPVKEEHMFDDDPYDVYFPLGWTTRYLEILCRMYAKKLKRQMTAIILRPTAIYGKYGDFNLSTCHVLPALIRRVAERQNPLEIWGTGEIKRDFIYVDDVVDACLLALEKVDGFDEFNIGAGKTYSVKELLKLIINIDQYNDAHIKYDKSKQMKAPVISVDCSKAKERIAFETKTSISEGIALTLNWFKKNYLIKESECV